MHDDLGGVRELAFLFGPVFQGHRFVRATKNVVALFPCGNFPFIADPPHSCKHIAKPVWPSEMQRFVHVLPPTFARVIVRRVIP